MYPNVPYSSIYNSRQTWKQPRCLLTDEWIKKLWYIYTTEYYSAIRRDTFKSVLMKWMSLEPIIQSEVSQKEKNKYCILTHICGIQKDGTEPHQQHPSRCHIYVLIHNTDIENRLRDKGQGEEGDGEMNGETSMDAYTLTYVNRQPTGSAVYDSGNSNWGSVITQRGWAGGGREI